MFSPLRAVYRPLALPTVRIQSNVTLSRRTMAVVAPSSPPRADAAGDASSANENSTSSGNGGKPWDDGLITRILHIRRTARVTRAGKVRSLYALVVVGNGNGGAGYGEGKSTDLGGAVQKAMKRAKRDMIVVNRYDNRTIFGTVVHKFIGSEITLRPAPPGELFLARVLPLLLSSIHYLYLGYGISANQTIHEICRCAGIQDISAKVVGSMNPMNVVKGTCELWPLTHWIKISFLNSFGHLRSRGFITPAETGSNREKAGQKTRRCSPKFLRIPRIEMKPSFNGSSIQRTSYPADRAGWKRTDADPEKGFQMCNLGVLGLGEGGFQL
jgi:ribosomal protein S5